MAATGRHFGPLRAESCKKSLKQVPRTSWPPGAQKSPKTESKKCQNSCKANEKLNRGISKPGGFPLFAGKVQIVSRTLSGLFLVGALNRPRKRKGTNQENPRTIPEQIGKIPEKSGKSQKGQKRKKKGRTSPDWETPPFESPLFGGP